MRKHLTAVLGTFLGAILLTVGSAYGQRGGGAHASGGGGFHSAPSGGGFHGSSGSGFSGEPRGGSSFSSRTSSLPSRSLQESHSPYSPSVPAGGPRFAGGASRNVFGQPAPRGGPLGIPAGSRGSKLRTPINPVGSSVRARGVSHYGPQAGHPQSAVVSGLRSSRGSFAGVNGRGSRVSSPKYGRGRDQRRLVVYGGGYGWNGYGYAPWLFYPWLDADLSYNLWYGDDAGSGQAAPAGSAEYDNAQQYDPGGYGNGEVSEDADPNAPNHPLAASMENDRAPATLLFRDGRAPIRTGNYVVSAEGVTVSDGGNVQVVPMAALDIPATNRINADAGSGLHLGQ